MLSTGIFLLVAYCLLAWSSKVSSTKELEIQCIYEVTPTENYICQLRILNESAEYETITKANGTHELGKSNENVNFVQGFRLDATYLPLGFGTVFRGLRSFQIFESNLKFIKRENFADMKNLTLLTLTKSCIETLPEDVFWDLPELECLVLVNNKIKVLPEKLFSNNLVIRDIFMSDAQLVTINIDLTKLQKFSSIELRRNVCINSVYRLPSFSEAGNSLLDFQKTLNEKCSNKSVENRS